MLLGRQPSWVAGQLGQEVSYDLAIEVDVAAVIIISTTLNLSEVHSDVDGYEHDLVIDQVEAARRCYCLTDYVLVDGVRIPERDDARTVLQLGVVDTVALQPAHLRIEQIGRASCRERA